MTNDTRATSPETTGPGEKASAKAGVGAPRRARGRSGVRWVRLTVGLALAGAAAALWVRSRSHTDYVVFFTPGAKVQGAVSDARGVFLAFSTLAMNPELGLTADAGSVAGYEFEEMRDMVYDSVTRKRDRWGFGVA